MSSRTIGCAAGEFLYEIENKGARDFLRNHPGRAASILHQGSNETLAEFEKGSPLCESPIEREMLAALLMADWRPFGKDAPRIWNTNDKDDERPLCSVLVMPQFGIARFRLDFAISVPKHRIETIVAVECDGQNYHDQATDFRRDGALACFGVLVLRFQGSEIKRDPARCAARVIEVAAGWSQL